MTTTTAVPDPEDPDQDRTESSSAAIDKPRRRRRRRAPLGSPLAAAFNQFDAISKTFAYQQIVQGMSQDLVARALPTLNFTSTIPDLTVPRFAGLEAIPQLPDMNVAPALSVSAALFQSGLPTPLPDLTARIPRMDLAANLPDIGIAATMPTFDLTAHFPDFTAAMGSSLPSTSFALPQVPELEALRGITDISARLEAAIPRVGMAQQTLISDVLRQVMPVAKVFDAARLALPPIQTIAPGLVHAQNSLTRAAASIAGLLSNWDTLADLGHRLARRALSAARAARAAALRGESESVDRFAMVWLGFKHVSSTLHEAVVTALLEPGWDQVDDDGALVGLLKSSAKRHHRNVRPIGETQLGYRHVAALDRQIGEDGSSLSDLAAAPDQISSQGYTDPRILELLSHFDPIEVEIIEVYADGGVDWASAAVQCGQSPAVGESVRRRVAYRRGKIRPAA